MSVSTREGPRRPALRGLDVSRSKVMDLTRKCQWIGLLLGRPVAAGFPGVMPGSTRTNGAGSWNPMMSFFGKVLRDPDSAVRRSARKPWWQMAKTARQGFIAAASLALLGVAALLASIFVSSHLWVGTLIWLPLAAFHLASAIALRRRERSAFH